MHSTCHNTCYSKRIAHPIAKRWQSDSNVSVIVSASVVLISRFLVCISNPSPNRHLGDRAVFEPIGSGKC